MNGEENIITVFIVAASPVMRAGLNSVLQSDDELTVAGSAAELSAAPANFSPGQAIDVLLVNVEREKDLDDLLELLSDDDSEEINLPRAVVLFPPEMQSSEYTLRVLQRGVWAVLPDHASASEITAAIKSAASGLISFSSQLAQEFLSLFAATASSTSTSENYKKSFQDEIIETLTPREAEILEMLAEGASNKSIAYQLNISEHTVKFHVASIFGKLGVNSRAEAVTQAVRRGLILL